MEKSSQFNFFNWKKDSLAKSTGRASAYIMWEVGKSVAITGSLVVFVGLSFMVFESFKPDSFNQREHVKKIHLERVQDEQQKEKEKILEKKNTENFYQHLYDLKYKDKAEVMLFLQNYNSVKFGLETKSTVSVTLNQQFSGFSTYQPVLLEFDKNKLMALYIKYSNEKTRNFFQKDDTIMSDVPNVTEGYGSSSVLKVEFKEPHAKR